MRLSKQDVRIEAGYCLFARTTFQAIFHNPSEFFKKRSPNGVV